MSARVFPFPTLAAESLDYREGEFDADIRRNPNATVVSVQYTLRGQNLIADLLRKGDAKFACVLCAPATMYREVQAYDGTPAESEDKRNPLLEANQHAKFDDSLISAPPMFRPIIVAARTIERTVNDADGLDDMFGGKLIRFPEGAIIAANSWQRLCGGISGLLVIVPDNSLSVGEIRVDPDPSNGYRFRVMVHAKFHHLLVSPEGEQRAHRNSVLTHALSAALSILFDEFGPKSQTNEGEDNAENEERWKQYPNLRFLSDELSSKNYCDWTDDKFKPEYAATLLRPHIIAVQE